MTSASLPPGISVKYIADVLLQAGALGGGRVRDVVVDSSRGTILSQITRLSVSCENAHNAPKSIILKTGHPDRDGKAWNGGRKEVEFYTEIASGMSPHLVPRCFGASWDRTTGAWHILLEDLSETHMVATTWPLPPTLEQCERIMQVRAKFQAAWWDDPRLGVSLGSRPDATAPDSRIQSFVEELTRFTDRLGDRLPRERRSLFERLIDAAPRLLARYETRRNLTIVQGDAHVWNCFLPRDPGSDDARLLDWDSWRVATGSDDLAYMMAVHWYPDLRRDREGPLLDHFHRTLAAYGVVGYTRRALNDDYRVSVLAQVMTPVWQAANDIPTVIWWNNLERVLMAVDDLECFDLL